jgi:hypothetical protein
MTRHRHKKHRVKLRSFYVWHRYIGVSAALFVLILAVTGIALNHTENLELDSRYMRAEWLLDWYGMPLPERVIAYQAGAHQVTLFGERLYFDSTRITGEYSELVGAISLSGFIAVAVDDGILLLTETGDLLERLDSASGIPSNLRAVGARDGDLFVLNAHSVSYRADADLIQWRKQEVDATETPWQKPVVLDQVERRTLAHLYQGDMLSAERFLLDLHSGRLFGRFGPWLMDGAACFLILLALSGSWMWLRRRR